MNVTIDLKTSTWKEQAMAWVNTSRFSDTLIVLLPPSSQTFFITKWHEGKLCCDWGLESGWEWIKPEEVIPKLQYIEQMEDA